MKSKKTIVLFNCIFAYNPLQNDGEPDTISTDDFPFLR